jgi:hypothetical protein
MLSTAKEVHVCGAADSFQLRMAYRRKDAFQLQLGFPLHPISMTSTPYHSSLELSKLKCSMLTFVLAAFTANKELMCLYTNMRRKRYILHGPYSN